MLHTREELQIPLSSFYRRIANPAERGLFNNLLSRKFLKITHNVF